MRRPRLESGTCLKYFHNPVDKLLNLTYDRFGSESSAFTTLLAVMDLVVTSSIGPGSRRVGTCSWERVLILRGVTNDQ